MEESQRFSEGSVIGGGGGGGGGGVLGGGGGGDSGECFFGNDRKKLREDALQWNRRDECCRREDWAVLCISQEKNLCVSWGYPNKNIRGERDRYRDTI